MVYLYLLHDAFLPVVWRISTYSMVYLYLVYGVTVSIYTLVVEHLYLLCGGFLPSVWCICAILQS
jgi:hypothetical protein